MSTLGARITSRAIADRTLPIARLCVSGWSARIETRRAIPEAAKTAALEAGSFLSNAQRDALLAMPLRKHRAGYKAQSNRLLVFSYQAVRSLIPLGFAYDNGAAKRMEWTTIGENYAREIMRARSA